MYILIVGLSALLGSRSECTDTVYRLLISSCSSISQSSSGSILCLRLGSQQQTSTRYVLYSSNPTHHEILLRSGLIQNNIVIHCVVVYVKRMKIKRPSLKFDSLFYQLYSSSGRFIEPIIKPIYGYFLSTSM